MVIGRKSRPFSAGSDDNPHEMAIETAWQDVRAALAAYDGHRAASLLERLSQVDRPVWNAVHWRTEDWLVSWFEGRGLGRSEQWPSDDFSREALTAFLFRIYPGDIDAAVLMSAKIPRILQELRTLDAEVRQQRTAVVPPAAPPARVLREVRAVAPGSLFEDDQDGRKNPEGF